MAVPKEHSAKEQLRVIGIEGAPHLVSGPQRIWKTLDLNKVMIFFVL